MSRRHANILRASAAWAVWVWAVLIRNMLVDHTHSVGFRVVHITLAVVSLTFAAATLWVASRGRRLARASAEPPAAAVPAAAGPAAAGPHAGAERPPLNVGA